MNEGPHRFFHDASAIHRSDLMLSRSFGERPYMVYRIVDSRDDEKEELAHTVFDLVVMLPIYADKMWTFNGVSLEHLFDCVGTNDHI